MIRIEPRRGLAGLQLREIWGHLELLWFLTWRELKIRYKQAVLGISWVVLQPVLTMIVFSIFFGRLVKVPSDNLPYPVFVFAGLVPWTLFANGLTRASQSLVSSAHLITKVYFPRVLLPIAASLAAVVDFGVAFVALLALMVFYGVQPGAAMFWLPAFIVLALATSMAASLWLGALNVRYRDVQAALPFVVQLWFFATPVVYPASLVRGTWRIVFGLNPMVGVIEGFRWSLLRAAPPPATLLALSTGVAVIALGTGLTFFRVFERSFADWV